MACGCIAVFANHVSAFTENGKAGLGALLKVLLFGAIKTYQMALHGNVFVMFTVSILCDL